MPRVGRVLLVAHVAIGAALAFGVDRAEHTADEQSAFD